MVVAHQDGREGVLGVLGVRRERARDPDGLGLVRRGGDGLQAPVLERHQHQAPSVGDAREVPDGSRELGRGLDLAGRSVADLELVVHGQVDVAVHDDGIGAVGPVHAGGGRVHGLRPGCLGTLGGRGRGGGAVVGTPVAGPGGVVAGPGGVGVGGHVRGRGDGGAVGAVLPGDHVAGLENHGAGTHVGALAVDEELPVAARGLVPAERGARDGRGDGGEVVAIGGVAGLMGQASGGEHLLGEVGSRGALGDRELGQGQPVGVLVRGVGSHHADPGRDGALVGRGQGLAPCRVAPDHGVAVLEEDAVGAGRGHLAVHEELPVAAGGGVPAKGLARGRRDDGVQVVAVVRVVAVDGEAGGREELFAGHGGAGALIHRVGAGGPGLRRAEGVHAHHGHAGRNLRHRGLGGIGGHVLGKGRRRTRTGILQRCISG